MNELLLRIHEVDPASRVEFSSVNKKTVICWVCYKRGSQIISGSGKGPTHEQALEDALHNIKGD